MATWHILKRQHRAEVWALSLHGSDPFVLHLSFLSVVICCCQHISPLHVCGLSIPISTPNSWSVTRKQHSVFFQCWSDKCHTSTNILKKFFLLLWTSAVWLSYTDNPWFPNHRRPPAPTPPIIDFVVQGGWIGMFVPPLSFWCYVLSCKLLAHSSVLDM